VEYWHSSIAGCWLVADKVTGRIIAQVKGKLSDVAQQYPNAHLCHEM